MPLASSTNIIKAAANDIIQALAIPLAQSPLAPLTDSESAAIKTLDSILDQHFPPTDTPTEVHAPAPTPIKTTPPSDPSSPTTLHGAPTPNDNTRITATVHPYPTSFGNIKECYDSFIIGADGEDHFDTNRLVLCRKTTPPVPIPENTGKYFTILHPPDASNIVPPAQLTHPGIKITIIAQPQTLAVNTPSNSAPAMMVPKETQGRSTRFRTNKHKQSRRSPCLNPQPTPETIIFAGSDQKISDFAAYFTELLQLTNNVLYKAVQPDTGKLVNFPKLFNSTESSKWWKGKSNEIGRLAQGFKSNDVKGTETLYFIFKHKIPKVKIPTHLKNVVANRLAKANPRLIQWTLGGDRIVYLVDKSTKTADLTTFKILCSSVVSTTDGRFMTINIKNFYLNTTLACFEYMNIPAKDIAV